MSCEICNAAAQTFAGQVERKIRSVTSLFLSSQSNLKEKNVKPGHCNSSRVYLTLPLAKWDISGLKWAFSTKPIH